MKLQAQSTLGASFGSRTAVTGFSCDGLGLHERSDIGCVLIVSAVDPQEVLASLSAAAGVELPFTAGAIKNDQTRTAVWLSPRSWLVLCELNEEAALVSRINETFADKRAHAAHFTDYLCWFEFSGARVGEHLKRLGFVSLEPQGLPVDHAKRTMLAGIAAVVIHQRVDEGLIGVERSRARYFSSWLNTQAT